MAPQATVINHPSVTTSAASTPKNPSHPFIPITLFVFLGLCLVYTFSYILYRIFMARRRRSAGEKPDSPDRGVSQFMNGARLTLNLSQNQRQSTDIPGLSESLNMFAEGKPLAAPSRSSHVEFSASSPAESSTPTVVSSPLTIDPNQEIQFPERSPSEAHVSTPASLAPPPSTEPPPFSQRVTAEMNAIPQDRVDAIALDPKLAPVQGPLRPLSMVQSPSPKKRTTLFGLGLKTATTTTTRDRAEDLDGDSGRR